MSSAIYEAELSADPDILAESIEGGALTLGASGHSTTLSTDRVTPSTLSMQPFRLVPLVLDGSTFKTTFHSADLLAEIGGGAMIHRITDLFYERVFQDKHISKFVQEPSLPHAQRLGNWIIEKMGGEGNPWSTERVERSRCPMAVKLGDGRNHVVHDRTSAHVAAWFSPRRPMDEMGERFKLHDSVVWMRLMFWSARDRGAFDISPSFRAWYVKFIAHFIAVYERSAPPYAEAACDWSADSANMQAYEDNNRMMPDISTFMRK